MNTCITGSMISRLRMAKGFAQKQVAARLQITQQAYSKIERTDFIKAPVLQKILAAMHTNMEELALSNFLHADNKVSKSRNAAIPEDLRLK